MDADEVREELEALGPDGFGERYGRFFLVITDPDQLEDMAHWVNTESRPANDITRSMKAERAVYLPVMDLAKRQRAIAGRFDIGREPPAHIVLGQERVSKLHAYFVYNAGLLSLTDSGSKNGTKLNGQCLTPGEPASVDLGDIVEFGPVATTLWGVDDLVAALMPRAQ
jgi:pSer/pThr/pTyr-binding forkhead associated (FHA) protein